jgi:uncharacterized protein YlxW (UPF0749 family)
LDQQERNGWSEWAVYVKESLRDAKADHQRLRNEVKDLGDKLHSEHAVLLERLVRVETETKIRAGIAGGAIGGGLVVLVELAKLLLSK